MLVPFLAELVDLVHRAGALAGWQVGSAEAARDAGDAGCDLIVVRGVEGGGRMYGDRSLWPLLAEVLDAAEEPVGRMTMGPIEMDVPRFGVAPPSTTATGNIDAMALYARESAGAVASVDHAAEVVRRMVADAEALLARYLPEDRVYNEPRRKT